MSESLGPETELAAMKVGRDALTGVVDEAGRGAAERGAAVGRRRFETLRVALLAWRTRIGVGIVALIVLIAIVGPFLAPHSSTAFVASPFARPSSRLPLGADYLGRDVLSRYLHGGYVLLMLASLATAFSIVLGTAVGLTAGYVRGFWDDLLMRGGDVLLCFPPLVFGLLLVSVIGPKLWLLVLAVGLSQAPFVARVMRGAALQLTGREFISYAESIGTTRIDVVRHELLPNVMAPLMVQVGLGLTYSTAIMASLEFLGFGRQPPAADWALMINENRSGLTIQPWAVLVPVLTIALLTIGMSLIADGIARASAGIDAELELEQ
jgi:peptide/nickel transport system permease protein